MALAVAGAVLLVGCATGLPVGLQVASSTIRYRPPVASSLAVKQQPAPAEAPSEAKGEGEQPRYTSGARAARDYREFLQKRRGALGELPKEEQALEEATLRKLEEWVWQQEEATLRKRYPVEVYVDVKEALRLAHEREQARRAAVEAKLEEYLEWAEVMAARMAGQHSRRVGREYWASDSVALRAARGELVSAVLAWALRHTEDADFPRKSPSEVALYLLATRGALASALLMGQGAPATLEHVPMRDKRPEEEEEDEARELVVGLTPLVGELVDFTALVTGYNVAGRRRLEEGERLLCAVGMVIPLLPGRAAGLSAEALQRAALLTGRGLDEVYTMARVAQHLAPREARELERLTRKYARGGQLTDGERDFLKRTAREVEEPLLRMREAFERGQKVPLLAVRRSEAGLRLVPGSPEHQAQAWVEYQFRHSGRYPRFRYAPDEKWRRMYQTVLENKGKGGAFEMDVLKQRGLEKNHALMLPPPGSKAQGFAPDAVPGNPNPGELVWGTSYAFTEAKAHKHLSLTGNLKAMIEYIEQYGGHLELWVRSAKHPDGPTMLSGPLLKKLEALERNGKARIKYHP